MNCIRGERDASELNKLVRFFIVIVEALTPVLYLTLAAHIYRQF